MRSVLNNGSVEQTPLGFALEDVQVVLLHRNQSGKKIDSLHPSMIPATKRTALEH